MDAIPQETYDQIATHLGDTGKCPGQPVPDAERAFHRPLLATISRKWQLAIERRSLGALKLKRTELDEFETIITSARRRHLRILRFYILLPAYPAGSRKLFERHGTAWLTTRLSVQQYTASSESSSLGRIKAVIGLGILFSFKSIISILQQIIASLAVHTNQLKRNSCIDMVNLVCDTDTPTFVF
jgi:hypothetical protein